MDTVQILNYLLLGTIALIFILGIIAIVLILRIRSGNKNDKKEEVEAPEKADTPNLVTRTGKGINSIYKFMEFEEIIDNMIIRKNRKQFVMVIQCKGINYDLLSEDEKNAVEAGFMEFLNTLRFPVQLYVQTRTLNLNEIIQEYEKRILAINDQIIKLNSQIEMARTRANPEIVNRLMFEKQRKENILEYGESIEDYTKKISESKNILQQKTYIVISYYINEFGDVSKYSKEEVNDIAFTELYTRAQTVIRSLTSAEVTGKVLDSEELAELLYVAYNRDTSEKYSLKDALNSEYDRLYSTAKDVFQARKQRIEKEVEEEAIKLASRSIIRADEVTREQRRQQIKQRASEMVDQYKGQLSNRIYNEAQNQIQNANIDEQKEQESTRQVIRKNV